MARTGRRLVVGGVVIVATLVWMAGPAGAHALAISSTPAPGSDLVRPPTEVVILFTERPDPALSLMEVLDTSGAVRAGGRATPVPGRPTGLEIAVHGLGRGVYTVTWRTVSAVDGHLAAGSFAFGVNASPARAPGLHPASAAASRPSTAAVAVRWAYYLGLIGLVGFTYVGLMVIRPAPRRLVRVALPTAWFLGAAGAIGISEVQRSGAGASLTDLFGSSLGRAFITRGLPLIAALVGVLMARRRTGRFGLAVAETAGALAMLADVDTSHAAAAASWTWYRMLTQFAHFLAVGVWIGGLAALLICLGRLGPDARVSAVRRFSAAAGVGIGVVAATGALRALDEVGSWSNLVSTGFGQVVLVKIGLLGLLGALGGINRFRHVAVADQSVVGLRRFGRIELVVGGTALVAAAILQNLAPARLASAATALPTLAPLTVSASDFATTVRAQVVIDPGTVGFDRFRLQVTDYDTGAPVEADRISLHFDDPSRPDIGDSILVLPRVASGVYQASGANLSVQDTWTVTVLIQGAATGVEIPLSIIPQVPPVPVTVQRAQGQPDIYNAALTGGDKLQVYLDPDRPGVNELHAQYFDPSGRVLATTGYSVTQTRRAGGTARHLASRQLGVGHYVDDSTVARGRYRYVFTATGPDGTVLVAPIDVSVG